MRLARGCVPPATVRCLIAALLLSSPVSLAGQVITGLLTDARDGAPLRGAAVSLEGGGITERTAVSGPDGRFILVAPRVGAWVVRVRRVGHEDFRAAEIYLAAGERREMTIRVASPAIMLEGITARGEPRCDMRAGAEGDLTTIWEEIRKALFLTAHAAADSTIEYEYVSFERELDARTREVERDSVVSRTIRGGVPFAAVPVDSLAEIGFARISIPHLVLYAPDAEVLLSRRFLETHCFRLEPGAGAREGLLGLSFAPVRGHALPDVEGTLWVERPTLGLRTLDFRYTGIRAQDPSALGGTLQFALLPSGSWIVQSWRLYWPVAPIRFGRTAADARFGRHQTLREIGGSVIGIRP